MYIDYDAEYSLPEFIPTMVARARKEADKNIARDRQIEPNKPLILILAERYRKFHHSFCMCSRHTIDEDKDHPENNDPNDPQLHGRQTQPLDKDQRRGHLQLIVNAAAALCYIGRQLHAYIDGQDTIHAYMAVERQSQPTHYADGTEQQPYIATYFYDNHSITGDVHHRVLAWMKKVMGESDNPAERDPAAIAKAAADLQAMFLTDDAPQALSVPTLTCGRPMGVASHSRAVATPQAQ